MACAAGHARVAAAELGDDVGGCIGGTVVDHDDLRRLGLDHAALQRTRECGRAVEARDDDRNGRHGSKRAAER